MVLGIVCLMIIFSFHYAFERKFVENRDRLKRIKQNSKQNKTPRKSHYYFDWTMLIGAE